jgi:hypothetical protein
MRNPLVALVLFTLIACQPSVRQMASEEVRETFVGNTDYGYAESGQPFVTYLSPDGTIMLRHEGQDDPGRYRIEPDGRLCIQYEKFRQGEDICQTVWKGVNKFYSTLSDGRPGVTITAVRQGNAEGL